MKIAAWKKTAFTAAIAAVFSVTAGAADKTFINRIFFEDFIDVGRTIYENPVQSLAITGGTLLAGWAVFANDGAIAEKMRQSNEFNDLVFDGANYLGDGAFVLAANSFLFLGSAREKKAARLVIESILISGAINQVFKYSFGRVRPNATDDPYLFRPFSGNQSMPSGHTQTAFSWAVIIGDTYEIGWLTYPLAGLTAWARVYKSSHWPSDVLIGGVIGVVTAKILMASRNAEEEPAALEIRYSGLGTPMAGVSIKL